MGNKAKRNRKQNVKTLEEFALWLEKEVKKCEHRYIAKYWCPPKPPMWRCETCYQCWYREAHIPIQTKQSNLF